MPEVIYLAKKHDRQREKTRAVINKKTDEYNTVISSLQQDIYDISSAFEVYVQQTNDTIASLETKIEELNKNEYSKEYLTFEALEHTDITLSHSNIPNKSIEYSFDKSTWTAFTPASGAETIASLNDGDKMYVRATWTDNIELQSFGSTGRYMVSGNIMSLFYGDSFIGKNTFVSDNNCRQLFYKSTLLTDASNLIMPATTLTTRCYYEMFSGCTALVTAPALPSTTLANDCYTNMFRDCTSLTDAPALPATTLEDFCYDSMFSGCTSLTDAPALPATTLAVSCYFSMFADCTSLTDAPVLPATTLPNDCYANMFVGCKSLNYIKCLATDISASNCTVNWVNGVASGGVFAKDATMTGWTTGNDGIPAGWIVENVA